MWGGCVRKPVWRILLSTFCPGMFKGKTHRHKVLNTLYLFVSWLRCLNKTHPQSPTFPAWKLSGSQQPTSATKHKATRFYFPKQQLFLIHAFHSIPSRAFRKRHAGGGKQPARRTAPRPGLTGEGTFPGSHHLCAALQKGKQSRDVFQSLFFRRSKTALLSVGNPDTGKGVVRGVCQSAFSYRAWEAVRHFHVRCSYWDRSTSVSAGDRHEHSKPAVLDPHPKAEKLFIFEPS